MAKTVQTWWERPSRVFEIGLLVLAFALRIIYLSQVRDNPFFENPTMDPGFHLRWAKEIAAGNLWSSDVFFRAPFYPYLLAVFYKVTGGDLFVVRILQHLIGVFSVWGIYRLTRIVFSESAAKIAGLAAASFATVIYFENELLLDFLLIPWMLLVFFAFHRAIQTRRIKWVFVTGLMVGLFTITRPNILICLPILTYAVWRWIPGKSGWGPPAKRVLFFALGVLIPILPVTVHNAVVAKDFVLISSQAGINFYIGNNAEADGLSAAMPEPWGHTWRMADVQQYADKKAGRKLKPSEFSNFWLNEGLKWWRDEPGAALKLTFKKALLLMANTDIANNQNIRFFWDRYAPAVSYLPLSFGILAPCGLIGLLLVFRRNVLGKLMLWILLFYALSVIVFFVPARFRLPFYPLLFVGFGGFVNMVYRRAREKQWPRTAALVVPAVILMVVSFGRWHPVEPATDAQSVFQLGNAALRAQKFDEAEGHFRQTLMINPYYEGAHLNLGATYLKQGRLEPAAEEFLAEIRIDPESDKAHANLCTIRGLQKRWFDAETYGQDALRLNPENPTAIINLAHVWYSTHRFNQAAAILETAPELIKGSPAGRNALGGSYLQMRKFEEAEKVLRPLADGGVRYDPTQYEIDLDFHADELGFGKLPEHRARANYNLGWMWAMKYDKEKATDYFKEALKHKPKFGDALANLGAAYIDLKRPDTALVVFRTALEADPGNPGFVFNIGIAQLHLGDTTAAITQFDEALKLDPNFAPAAQKLQSLKVTHLQGTPVINPQ